ncbi:MAG TPA: type II secretion system F family protein [Candidatus Acidoferrales bacterium]|nr:type II secretion system F family protein [Candidatus Acidoferrales bacterium]
MLWLMTGITFLASFAVLVFLIYAFAPAEQGVATRLSRLFHGAQPAPRRSDFVAKQKAAVRDTLATIGKALPEGGPKQSSKTALMMTRAGYRSPNAVLAMQGVKILLPVGLLGIVFLTGLYHQNPVFIPLLAAAVGFLAPDFWLSSRVRARQHRLRKGLPDALDLLVICVEAGLGLDQALLRVAQELHIAHRDLSEELHRVNLEMRVGKTRVEALRELARRTGLEDVKSLVTMLIQTERFGTSIAQSLRVHSDDLRTKRRQRAEEMSAKTSVKMVPALVFFIFPALMVVILGPAVLAIMRDFPK